MSKKLVEMASEIVNTQASITSMTAAEISSALRQVFSTLHELQRAESGEIQLPKIQGPEPTKALTPQDSIQDGKIICLECGAEMKQLSRAHLSSHGMSAKEYKKKYGFTMQTPLAAKSLTKARQKAAKKRGIPENLQKYLETRRQAKAEAATETVTASKPTIGPENSIQDDKVICLECGAEFKQLTGRHLASHSLSPTEYKKKYGFSMGTPLYAKSVTKAMSEAQARRQQKARAAAKPAVPEASGVGSERAKMVRKRFSPKKVE